MTKERYMALDDVQTLWTDKIKPTIETNYANKVSDVASVDTCMSIINELV